MRRAALILALTALAAAPAPASADVRPPEPPCDPMACPDPVGGVRDCLNTASLAKDPNTGLPYVAGYCSPRDIIWG